jgi:C2 domain
VVWSSVFDAVFDDDKATVKQDSCMSLTIVALLISVQWNNLFPEWREKLKATPVADLSQLLMISVKDAAKIGENVPIGQCFIPLSKLLDQQSHTLWIPLEPALGDEVCATCLFLSVFI